MRKRYSLEEKREIITGYIKNNPKATHREIRRKTKLHVNRAFKSLEEAIINSEEIRRQVYGI